MDAGQLLNSPDVGNVVIETHISPGPIPVLLIILRTECLVVLRVLSAAIVANPNIVALFSEQ